MRIYYKIWVDCINNLLEREDNKKDWKFKSMIAMNFAMIFNFALIMIIIQKYILGYFFYTFEPPNLSKFWNNVFVFAILFILPCVTLNYILIFYNDRYKMLIKKYSYNKGRLFMSYFLISILIPIILIIISVLPIRW